MNKTKRNIIQLRANLVRKLASQIEPFKLSKRWLNAWYTENAKTPLQVRSEILQMRKKDISPIYFKINIYLKPIFSYGNLFNIKFPMIIHVCKMDIHSAGISYNTFFDIAKVT